MTASLLDGKTAASAIKNRIKQTVATRVAEGLSAPGLAVILLGNDAASSVYVANKRRACAEVGFHSEAFDLPDSTSEKELLTLIDALNNDPRIHGILVQLPLPKHMNTTTIIERISPAKDVDGFHPYNLGRLAQGHPKLRPCTPFGVMTLLSHYQQSVASKHAVIVGTSNIVGRPMALEFLLAKATVTLCHRQTKGLEKHIRMADIVVVAAGVFDVVSTDWFHHNQIIIDVGIHRRANGTLHGDVDFDKAVHKVDWITPVPGGVGPMTIATLLQNTLLAVQIIP